MHNSLIMNRNSNISPEYLECKFSIGVAAEKCNVSVHTLRLYEAEGLILMEKTESGRRLFSNLEIDKILSIRKMVQEGLNFEGIRRLISLVPCWKIRHCNSGAGKKCSAYQNRRRPCWATETKCVNPLPSCRLCPIYQELLSYNDIIRYIKAGYE